ncbi:MAG: phosphoribosylaminoimidazolecarboxamide formyltransferase / cyclohydrolase [Kosmotogales bacterium]|nr:phosphoribosylaminoimidazolecarboxamide formyltransferase / cyclohydrolase [Kosmotogales bacterium]
MKRALISVYNKDNIENLAEVLIKNDFEIVSTGGTLKYLKERDIPAIEISEITNFKEMLDGRVKTLHPKIHGGLLALRDNKEHMKTLEEENIETIDCVVVNLYPFFENMHSDITFEDKMEFIDIGGPTMLRSAAKNFKDVIVVSDPDDYKEIITQFDELGDVSYTFRKKLAGKVFNLTSAYDAAISNFLLEEEYPKYLNFSLKRGLKLRYGENPHQSAAFYENLCETGLMNNHIQLQGKTLSYNNINDMNIAYKSVYEFDECACVSLKHHCPCGVAVAETPLKAYELAYECDPVSIFGGIVAFNRRVDKLTAMELKKLFLEIVVAPDFDEEALEVLSKKKKLRVIKSLSKPGNSKVINSVDGGFLIQDQDKNAFEEFKTVTTTEPTKEQIQDMNFGIKAIKNVISNAIIIVKENRTLGIAGGQVNRIWAAKQAIERANLDNKSSEGAVLISDAFFPFDDVVKEAAKAKISAIVQPGGSIRDKDSISEADKNSISMVFTGVRHFKH